MIRETPWNQKGIWDWCIVFCLVTALSTFIVAHDFHGITRLSIRYVGDILFFNGWLPASPARLGFQQFNFVQLLYVVQQPSYFQTMAIEHHRSTSTALRMGSVLEISCGWSLVSGFSRADFSLSRGEQSTVDISLCLYTVYIYRHITNTSCVKTYGCICLHVLECMCISNYICIRGYMWHICAW